MPRAIVSRQAEADRARSWPEAHLDFVDLAKQHRGDGRGLLPRMSESSSGKRRPARRATSQRRHPPQANLSPTDELAALRDRVGTLERELAEARARASEAAEQQAATSGLQICA